MLDFKIDYLLSAEEDIFNKLLTKYDKGLSIRGKQDVSLGIYLKSLFYTLGLSSLGDHTRLELYKKLQENLRQNGLVFKIPTPDLPDAAVNPYYYGVGAQGLTGGQIQLLNEDATAKGDKSYEFSLTAQVYYVMYPAYYGVLSSILDNNGFETLPGWTSRTETITVLSVEISYLIYEFNYITTQSNFTNTFKH